MIILLVVILYTMIVQSKKLLRCYHCGNLAIHELFYEHECQKLFDEVESGEVDCTAQIYKTFKFISYKCTACNALNMVGGFEVDLDGNAVANLERLYPVGPNIQPPRHHWGSKEHPVPEKLVKAYEEIWPLKHQTPNAFGNQIRRCLEFICIDKKADGKTLYDKLMHLNSEGYLPGNYKDISNIIRIVGNIGSHLTEKTLDYWDVELLDEFFKILINYIYVVPSTLKRMEQRINYKI